MDGAQAQSFGQQNGLIFQLQVSTCHPFIATAYLSLHNWFVLIHVVLILYVVKSMREDLICRSQLLDMQKEINLLRKIRHPNIVLFFGAGTTTQGHPYLVLELVERGTLANFLAVNPNLPWDCKLSFVSSQPNSFLFIFIFYLFFVSFVSLFFSS